MKKDSMPKAEIKRPIGIKESVYNEIEEYADKNNLFMFEVVNLAWEHFKAVPEDSYKKENRIKEILQKALESI